MLHLIWKSRKIMHSSFLAIVDYKDLLKKHLELKSAYIYYST